MGCLGTRIALLVCLFVLTAACCHGYPISNEEDPSGDMSGIAISAPSPTLETAPVPHLHLPNTTGWQPNFLTACDFASHTDLSTGCMISQISPGSGSPMAVGVFRFDAPPLLVDTSKGSLHWGPAFWQSVEFMAVEHSFRIASDPYARYLLFHKPFWHDYFASANHFQMYRWGDGDDFLVNYIGHPLQGAVTGNIFLQNDPRGRSARFGRSSAYWHSRLQAMAWSAVYSVYFEIGPVLSEAAIGNEGGYTYVPSCGFYPCREKGSIHYKAATNNTGWVDFVITPVVGTGWVVLEDAIEREFVDRVAKGSSAPEYQLLRGALAPSHTFSNLLAGKSPWYRYHEKDYLIAAGEGLPEEPTEIPEWKTNPRLGMGFQMTSLELPAHDANCPSCQDVHTGLGFNFDYRFAKYAYFVGGINFFPSSDTYKQPGNVREVLAGLKIGPTFRSWGLFAEVKPGGVHYDTPLGHSSGGSFLSTTRIVQNFGGSAEYYPSKHS
ncbi:MAG TPA: hypothetical protein VE195_05955, partial [Acidobacteriaceae bacterium]|nr:hypothetical protein [Acidobacteriaceae bacterium]